MAGTGLLMSWLMGEECALPKDLSMSASALWLPGFLEMSRVCCGGKRGAIPQLRKCILW